PEQSSAKRRRGSGGNSVSAHDAAQRVRDDLPELLGKPIESVLGIRRSDDDGWEVTVAVVELSRIPNSTDVLGAYRVTLDGQGELEGYQRIRRYNRSQADED
ncbi:MAG: gas vesicle protein, partial [Solirubrobacteraceae bacterium]